MPAVATALRSVCDRKKIPWAFLAVALTATAIQFADRAPAPWSAALIYDRPALASGQWWRLWTGHLVHYGWLHFAADTAMLLILGRAIEWRFPAASRLALLALPPIISAAIYCFDPGMIRYAGLSALNLAFLVFYAGQSWQRNWLNWFWPAVLLVYVGELMFEAQRGGTGGGLVAFSDPTVSIATSAHLAGGACGLALWFLCRRRAATP